MSDTVNVDFPGAITPEAKIWNGWKSHGLKPAYEPIIVAMKPNEGSYANNALKWGVAGLNIDGGRISYQNEQDKKEGQSARKTTSKGQFATLLKDDKYNRSERDNIKGRYPANLILDEEAGRLLDEQSGECKTGGRKIKTNCGNAWYKQNVNIILPQDNGSAASRFFYCAKASKSERNRGCEGLEEKRSGSMIGCIDNGNFLTGSGNKRQGKSQNNHPTVKPLSLMKYLCTITKTPTGGIVLDPFCGSGTTLMACKESKRDYIGVDNIPEYCEIARKRVNSIPEPLF